MLEYSQQGASGLSRLKYLLGVVLLLAVAASTGYGCVLFESSSNPADASGTPICTDWTPAYIDDEVGPSFDEAGLVENLAPTVVSIISEKRTYDRFFRPVPERGAGSGVIIDPQGFIVTNEHVVRDAQELQVYLSDGRKYDAVAWVRDAATDLAVVQIEPDQDLPYAHFLSGSLGKLGLIEEVVAVGNALALPGGPTWTKGVVSYLGRSIEVTGGVVLDDLIQTDAAINPGNSGGPLVNMAGQVVGINTAIAEGAENIGFAISTDTAIPVVNDLITRGFVSCAYLGVTMLSVTPAVKEEYGLSVDYGALIVEVVSGSPAYDAGLKADDVIIKFAGTEVADADQLRVLIRSRNVGDRVAITYVRGQSTFTTDATLVLRPSS